MRAAVVATAEEVIKMGFTYANVSALVHGRTRRAETARIHPGAIVFVAVVAEKKITPACERHAHTRMVFIRNEIILTIVICTVIIIVVVSRVHADAKRLPSLTAPQNKTMIIVAGAQWLRVSSGHGRTPRDVRIRKTHARRRTHRACDRRELQSSVFQLDVRYLSAAR